MALRAAVDAELQECPGAVGSSRSRNWVISRLSW
jgi:hypothetical protein